jgi:HK97 family phage portal protein
VDAVDHPEDLEARSLRPTDLDTPNENPPGVPPASVGVPDYRPGDPHGLELVEEEGPPPRGPTLFHASPWSGWPAEWNLPGFGRVEDLIDTAWTALDLNSRVFASMPPYLVGASPNLPRDWIDSPDPGFYRSWADFAHAFMWDFLLGEVIVLATARYSGAEGPGTGWPARFHVVPPWTVDIDHVDGELAYTIGGQRLDPADVLHVRYKATVDDTRGHGPLEVGRARLVAAGVLLRYLTNFVEGGAIPSSVLEVDDDLSAKQASEIHSQWINARMSRLGLPAIIDNGAKWKATQANALDTALTELAGYTEAKIAVLLGVPPMLLGLPSGGDSLTYSNAEGIYDFHWRGGLRPHAQRLMLALSNWLVPRGTGIEVNRDEYVKPGPLERAQTWAIYLEHGVATVEEVRVAERFVDASYTSSTPISGVLK